MAELPCPWLPWSTPRGSAEIRYDDPQAALAVSADIWETRAGWCWAAVVTPYVLPTCQETGARMPGVKLVPGTPKASGPMRAATDVAARAACEDWIVGEVAGG